MNDLVTALKKDMGDKIAEYRVVNIVGATDEAFRMLQLVGDESLRGFREFPEGRIIEAAVYRVYPDKSDVLVRMKSGHYVFRRESVFMDCCDGEFVLVKMMD